MNYETALKLKKAGFPQEGKGDRYPLQSEIGLETAYVPTLPELMAACEDRFWSLDWYRKDGKKIWSAVGKLDGKDGCVDANGEGSTPEIAVAELWLKLNPRQLTNGGKPHVCGKIAVHDGTRDKVTLCSKCDMPVDL